MSIIQEGNRLGKITIHDHRVKLQGFLIDPETTNEFFLNIEFSDLVIEFNLDTHLRGKFAHRFIQMIKAAHDMVNAILMFHEREDAE